MRIDEKQASEAIENYIRDLVEQNGRAGAIIGLSGGIDSAVLTTLAVRALGSERVRVLYLFDRDNESASGAKAQKVADWLGLELEKRDISPEMRKRGVYRPLYMRLSAYSPRLNRFTANLYQRLTGESPYFSTLRKGSGEFQVPLAKKLLFNSTVRHLENGFDARHIYRRQIVEDLAQKENRVVLGGANRSEAMVGWFVKEGIDDVPIQPLLGLYKTQVRQLAHYLGLPQEIRGQTPSPDMQKGISDEFGIGMSYGLLDQILDAMDRGLDEREMELMGIARDEIRQVRELHRLSHWKRDSPHVQPPVDGGVRSPFRVEEERKEAERK